MSYEHSGVPVAGLQVQYVYWLPLANRQQPNAYGADPVDALSASLLHVLL
jgi:hypothetical protein